MNKNQTAGLKGMAIIMIILFHLQYNLFGLGLLAERGLGLMAWAEKIAGYLSSHWYAVFGIIPSLFFIGVNFFFLLSGYGFVRKYYFKPDFSIKAWLKQIWKILLPYWLAFPITHLINYILTACLFLTGRIETMPGFFEIYLPVQYIESFFVPSRWFSERLALNFVGTWWFVGIILQFYLLFPLFIWIIKKIKARYFILIALLITFIYRTFVIYSTNSGNIGISGAELLLLINFPAKFAEFALGMYFATKTKMHFFKHQTIAGLLLIIIGLACSSYLWGMVISDTITALGLFLTASWMLHYFKSKYLTWLIWLGNKSYAIFLYHEPALKLILMLFFTIPF